MRWETVTQPKKNGGLGIRSARHHMNTAFLAKLGWRMLHEENSLWVKCLINKYMDCHNDINRIGNKRGQSNAWKAIVEGTVILKKGWRKLPRSGKGTMFWIETWLLNNPLEDYNNRDLFEQEKQAKVADYWNNQTGWKWNMIRGMFTEEAMERLASFVLSDDDS